MNKKAYSQILNERYKFFKKGNTKYTFTQHTQVKIDK